MVERRRAACWKRWSNCSTIRQQGGLFLTREKTGFTRTKETDDRTVPSGNAAALELFARLKQRTSNVVWRQQCAVAAGSGDRDCSERTGRPCGNVAGSRHGNVRGETGAHQAAAYGAVRVSVDRESRCAKSARIRIRLAPGWHVNSIAPKQDFLIPTKIKVDGVEAGKISFPKAVDRKLGFHDEALSLYEGDVEVGVDATRWQSRNGSAACDAECTGLQRPDLP